jgi:hypothetical protein
VSFGEDIIRLGRGSVNASVGERKVPSLATDLSPGFLDIRGAEGSIPSLCMNARDTIQFLFSSTCDPIYTSCDENQEIDCNRRTWQLYGILTNLEHDTVVVTRVDLWRRAARSE